MGILPLVESHGTDIAGIVSMTTVRLTPPYNGPNPLILSATSAVTGITATELAAAAIRNGK